MVHKSHSNRAADDDLQRDMEIMRQIMDKNWVALRALALGDEYPELAAATLIEMAQQQREAASSRKESRE